VIPAPPTSIRGPRGTASCGWLLAPALALLGPGAAAAAEPVAWQLRADAENWQLPAGETMGMVRLALRRQFGPWLAAGVDGSAAVRGSRGGFITLGVGAEAFVPLSAHLGAEAGLALGAGGGRGGYELAGGGLMTRAQLGLRYRWPGADALSVGVSRVDFPNDGAIRSTQLYVAYTHAFTAWSVPADGDGSAALPDGVASATHRLAFFVEPLSVGAGRARLDGAPQGNLGVVGAEWQTGLADGFYGRIAAAGAASGSSSGYMQVLGGLGYRWPLASRLAATASVSVGAGGGGSVDTGGGLLLEAAAGLALAVTRHDSLTLSAVGLKAPSGAFGAHGLTLGAAHRFGPDDAPGAAAPAGTAVHPVRLRVVDQQYRGTSAAWASRPNREFGTLGVQADYFVTPSLYVTGQGLAAYSGRNGAYMIGLAGAGWHQPLAGRVFGEVEALVGAAGGGGTAVGSGGVGQLNAALGYRARNGLGVLVSVGRLEARRGGFAANVAGLSFSYQTDLLARGD
jgi:hypothetical protein